MIVCSCNVLSDHDVRSAVNTAAPRTAGQVYDLPWLQRPMRPLRTHHSKDHG